MKRAGSNRLFVFALSCLAGSAAPAYGMGLRSFVALPVEKHGVVVRFAVERASRADTSVLSTSAAYGFNAKQTLLLGFPYRLSPAGPGRRGDVSALYRHIVWQQDSASGTKRLGLLGGGIIPTASHRDATVQAGFVFTYFKNRDEIDVDALYRAGTGDRAAGGQYDISWQHRIVPAERPDWGIPPELNTVLELNGRWTGGAGVTHQVTAGLQWLHRRWVIEGGVVKDLNAEKEWRYLLSTRLHF